MERLEGLVGVLLRLEKKDGDGVVDERHVIRSTPLGGVEEVPPPFVRLLLEIESMSHFRRVKCTERTLRFFTIRRLHLPT